MEREEVAGRQADRANINNCAQDEYEEGSQALVRHLAKKYPRPTKLLSSGLYSATKYLYMYVPDEAVDEAVSLVDADTGYENSSKDHYYRSMGDDANVSKLFRRQRPCACDSCLRLKPNECLLTRSNADREASLTASGTVIRIGEAAPRAEPAGTRGRAKTLAEHSRGLAVGDNVIARIHPDERLINPDEEYFVARVVGEAIKLDAPGFYSTQQYFKNDWIVKIQWYELNSVEANGDRIYSRGNAQFLHCDMLVRNLSRPIDLAKNQSHFSLSKNLDDYIIRYGAITA